MKKHAEKTLMNWTKKELVEHCMCLEHNYNCMEEGFEIQYQNYIKIVNDLKKER